MLSSPPNPPPIDIPSFISIPHFYALYMQEVEDGLKTPKMASTEMLKEDWVTDDLRHEIQSFFPNSNEKDGSGQRCLQSYKRKISVLFPPGHVFASFTQLVQASKLFLDAWAIQKVHAGKKISCHYGKSQGTTPPLHSELSKRR